MREFEAFCVGFVLCLFIFVSMWVCLGGVKKTVDGKFYIETHCQYYELVSNKPITIGTAIAVSENEK